MPILKEPFSLYIPVTIGCVNMNILIDENILTTNKECISAPHSHHLFEIHYISEGLSLLNVNGITHRINSGSLLLISPHEYHYQSVENTAECIYQYCIRFGLDEHTQSLKPYQKKAYSKLEQTLCSTKLLNNVGQKIGFLFSMLADEILKKQNGYISNLSSIASLLITEILRETGSDIECIFSTEELKYRDAIITKTECFFARNYNTDIKIQDLADRIHVSARQTARILKNIYGMTFSQRLTEIRLERAAYALLHTSDSVKEIGEKCGFNNSSLFHTCFKNKYNMTPIEFRNAKLINR